MELCRLVLIIPCNIIGTDEIVVMYELMNNNIDRNLIFYMVMRTPTVSRCDVNLFCFAIVVTLSE